MSTRRYTSNIDLANENNAHTLQILLTGADKNVLEVGTASGYITEALRDRGCSVTGVEYEAEAAKTAEQYAERMIVGDIETLDFGQAFRDRKFDVVIYGDVLEHLRNPEAVLARTREVLAPEGYIVASIPNVAHASLRLALLDGRFRYTDVGLLDKTHVRFFTRESIAEMFHNTGFEITKWRRVLMDPVEVEVGIHETDFPSPLIETLRADQDAMTYQYVVVARPTALPSNGTKALEGPQRIGEALRTLEAVMKERRETAERDVERLIRENRRLVRDLQVRTGELEGAHRRITDIEGSIGWRMLNRIRPCARFIAPRGSLRFRALRAGAKAGLRVMGTGAGTAKHITRPLRRGRTGRGSS